MSENDRSEVMDGQVMRFLIADDADKCPDCSSEDIRTATYDGNVAAANCPACGFKIRTDFADMLSDDDPVVWFTRRAL